MIEMQYTPSDGETKMKTTFTATFSNGAEIKRNSDHAYAYAYIVIDRESGEIRDEGFRTKPITESASHLFTVESRKGIPGRGYIKRSRKAMDADRDKLRKRYQMFTAPAIAN